MGITSDMMNTWQIAHPVFPDWTWVEGAIAGLDVCKNRDPNWLWETFVSELKSIQGVHDIKPLKPWQESDESSVLSALGGYVSITGKIGGDGLRFPLPFEMSEQIRKYLLGIDVVVHSHGITVPWKSMNLFTTQVPLRGPVEEWIQEVSN